MVGTAQGGDFRLTSLLAGCTDRRQCRRRGSGLAAAARRGSARGGGIVGFVFAVIEVESGHGAADPVRDVAAVSASCRRLGKAGEKESLALVSPNIGPDA